MSPFTICALWVFVVAVPSGGISQGVPSITVDYTIANDLVEEPFKYSIQVSVPEGSVLLAVLQEAQKLNPKHFSFSTESTTWGAFVSSINHLSGSTNEKTYWHFFSGKHSLDEGVSSYVPKDGEHIVAIFSKY